MIVFEKFGYTFKIRNDDWKKLRKRFNPDNAILYDDLDRYYINANCILCDRYRNNHCIKCPFDAFTLDITTILYGCSIFFGKLFRKQQFSVGTEYISWEKEVDKEARRQLKRLNKIMDKIEEENK